MSESVYGCKCVCMCAHGLVWLSGGAGCLLGVCVRGEGSSLIPWRVWQQRPGSGPPLPLARIQQGTRSPSLPLPLLFSCAPRGSGPGGSASAQTGLQSWVFPPAGPGSCGSCPLRPSTPLLPASLLPSRARLRAGWEEISLEFPFHTSRLNFLSVSHPLAVCSFSCHRKCQAKVRGLEGQLAGGWGGVGVGGGVRLRDRTSWGPEIGAGASVGRGHPLLLSLFMQSFRAQAQVKVKAKVGEGGVVGEVEESGWGAQCAIS